MLEVVESRGWLKGEWRRGGVAVSNEFHGCEVAKAGDVFFVEDLVDEGAEVGGEEGLDVVGGH